MSYIQLISVWVITLFSLQIVLRPTEAARYEPKAAPSAVRTMQVRLADPSQQLEAQGSRTAQTTLPMTMYVTEGFNPGLQRTTLDFNFNELRGRLAGRSSGLKSAHRRLMKGSPPSPSGSIAHIPRHHK